MKPLRVLALMHEDLVPPEDPGDADMLADVPVHVGPELFVHLVHRVSRRRRQHHASDQGCGPAIAAGVAVR